VDEVYDRRARNSRGTSKKASISSEFCRKSRKKKRMEGRRPETAYLKRERQQGITAKKEGKRVCSAQRFFSGKKGSFSWERHKSVEGARGQVLLKIEKKKGARH